MYQGQIVRLILFNLQVQPSITHRLSGWLSWQGRGKGGLRERPYFSMMCVVCDYRRTVKRSACLQSFVQNRTNCVRSGGRLSQAGLSLALRRCRRE
jgi:hypothetical protein